MMEYRTRLYFQDECFRIGSGWRDVEVKEGRKWAVITEIATGKRQRVTLDLLDVLEGERNPAIYRKPQGITARLPASRGRSSS